MKVVILAGGLGTRLSEETEMRPKPMVEIGGYPILWHIMKWYSKYGYNDFIICCGYKQYMIKEYFANYFRHTSDIEFDLYNHSERILSNKTEPWTVKCIDTGADTMTGGRIRRIQEHISPGEDFLLTYGDGVGCIHIPSVISKHRNCGNIVTLTATQNSARFGILDIEGDKVLSFREKPQGEEPWVNAGYFVCSSMLFDYLDDDADVLEQYPLTTIASMGKLGVWKHTGFWKPMDTLRDRIELERMYEENGNIYGE